MNEMEMKQEIKKLKKKLKVKREEIKKLKDDNKDYIERYRREYIYSELYNDIIQEYRRIVPSKYYRITYELKHYDHVIHKKTELIRGSSPQIIQMELIAKYKQESSTVSNYGFRVNIIDILQVAS